MKLENKFYLKVSESQLLEFDTLDACISYVSKTNVSLNIDKTALYYFLRNGIIVPPLTVYENIFTCAPNDKLNFSFGKVTIERTDFRDWWHTNKEMSNKPNFRKAVIESLRRSLSKNNGVLMLSSGKDSTVLLSAAAQAELQSKITCVTVKSDLMKHDESDFARMISKSFGFEHKAIDELGRMSDEFVTYLRNYFSKLNEPTCDFAVLQYPWMLFNDLISENCVLIDGGGNDQYLGVSTTKADLCFYTIFSNRVLRYLFERIFPNRLRYYRGRSYLERFMLTRTRIEDLNEILLFDIPKPEIWTKIEKELSALTLRKTKSYVVCTLAANEQHLKKVRLQRSFVEDVVFPFLDKDVINSLIHRQFRRKPKQELLNLLTDDLPEFDFSKKKGFSLNISKFIVLNMDIILHEISECHFINISKIRRMAAACKSSLDPLQYEATVIFQVYILCLWLNTRTSK